MSVRRIHGAGRRALALVLLSLATGCPTGTPGTTAAPKEHVTASGASATPPGIAATPPPAGSPRPTPDGTRSPSGQPVASPGPASPPALAAFALGGLVRLPAAIVSNNGGSIISDVGSGLINTHGAKIVGDAGGSLINTHGSKIIGNNGSGYRLAELLEQLPVVGARVQLLDAALKPVPGADGKPLVAITDDTGHYAFATAPGDHNYVVAIDMPGTVGRITGVAPRSADARRVVDLDVVSTLTTTFILDSYVAPQNVPQQTTLDKLPADVEADTRKKAAAAVAGGAALPENLSSVKVDAAVTSLRKSDPALDQQLEAVRKLLVVAGQGDLGAGRKGTDVQLGRVSDLALAPDGTLLVADIHRLWGLAADGTLHTVVGSGGTFREFAAPVDGKKGPEAGLFDLQRVAVGPKGDVIMFEPWDDSHGAKVLRLGIDGLMATYLSGGSSSGFDVVADLAFDPAGTPLALSRSATFSTILHGEAFNPAIAFTPRFSVSAAAGGLSAGRDAAGALYVNDGQSVFRLDPVTGKAERAFQLPNGAKAPLGMDHLGNAFYVDGAGKLMAWTTAGKTLLLLDALPAGAAGNLNAVAMVSDTLAYAALDRQLVYRIESGKATVVAGGGQAAATQGGLASDLAITEVTALAAFKNGDVLVGNGHQLYRVVPGGKATLLGGDVAGTAQTGDGVPVNSATFLGPTVARITGNDEVYLVDAKFSHFPNPWIRHITPDGKIATVFVPAGASDLLAADDGTIYWTDMVTSGNYKLRRRKPDGAIDTLFAKVVQSPMLAFTPTGDVVLWANDEGSGSVVKPDGSNRTLLMFDQSAHINPRRRSGFGSGNLAVDGRGRYYFANSTFHEVYRWDPATDTYETLAGPGGKFFKGADVNDSLDLMTGLAFDAAGNLYIADSGHKQIKQIAASDL